MDVLARSISTHCLYFESFAVWSKYGTTHQTTSKLAITEIHAQLSIVTHIHKFNMLKLVIGKTYFLMVKCFEGFAFFLQSFLKMTQFPAQVTCDEYVDNGIDGSCYMRQKTNGDGKPCGKLNLGRPECL